MTGTKLLREWDGVEHTVTVLKDGFDWQGRKFKSPLVARAITGTRWNGYRFFGLRERKRGKHNGGANRPNRRLRCAIYTRKSTEEGLDMDFNTLDAQREACGRISLASGRGLGRHPRSL